MTWPTRSEKYVAGTIGRQFIRVSFLKSIMCASFDSSAISAAELEVVTRRVGGSNRVRSGEFVTERKLEPGDKVCAELHLWVRARESVSPPRTC